MLPSRSCVICQVINFHVHDHGSTFMLCAFFCVFLSELLTHLNTIHRNDNDFSQKCGLPDCSSKTEYTSANSFMKHVRNHHRTLLNSTYEAVFEGNQDIHVSDHESECHVSDAGNVFYFIFSFTSLSLL